MAQQGVLHRRRWTAQGSPHTTARYSPKRDEKAHRCYSDTKKLVEQAGFKIKPGSETNGTSEDFQGIDFYLENGRTVQFKSLEYRGYDTVTVTSEEYYDKYRKLPLDTLLVHVYYKKDRPEVVYQGCVIDLWDFLSVEDIIQKRTNSYTGTTFNFINYWYLKEFCSFQMIK